MKTVHCTDRNVARFMDVFHSEDHPGGFVVGASQSTKTTFMQKCIHADIEAGRKMTVLDPHGQLSERARDFTLTLPKRYRNATNYICPADGIGPLPNLLGWDSPNEIPGVVDRFRRMTKGAYGDPPYGDATPNIDFYMDAGSEGAALLRLPPPFAADCIDRDVAGHRDLVAGVMSVDRTLGNRLDDISQMTQFEYLATVGPALRRLDTVLKKNPYQRDLLSNPESIDSAELLESRNFYNLKPANSTTGKVLLRPMDRQFWACAGADATLQEAYSIDESQRVHEHTAWYDEFQLFESLFETTIQPALSESAKFKFKQVPATQTVSNFHGGADSPVVQALLANILYLMLFRCQSDIDSRLFATAPHLYHFDPHRIKHVLKQKQQYNAGYDIITLINRTYQWMTAEQSASAWSRGSELSHSANRERSASAADSDTDTASWEKGKQRGTSDGHTSSHHDGSGTSENETNPLTPLAPYPTVGRGTSDFSGSGSADTSGSSQGESESKGGSNAQGHTDTRARSAGNGVTAGNSQNESYTRSDSSQDGGSVAYNQLMVPRYQWRTFISSIEYLSESEQLLFWQQVLVRMQKGECLLHSSKLGTAHLMFDKPVHAAEAMPKYIAEERATFLVELQRRPTYLDPARIDGQYARLVHQLPSRLPGLHAPREGHLLPGPVLPDGSLIEVDNDAPWHI